MESRLYVAPIKLVQQLVVVVVLSVVSMVVEVAVVVVAVEVAVMVEGVCLKTLCCEHLYVSL